MDDQMKLLLKEHMRSIASEPFSVRLGTKGKFVRQFQSVNMLTKRQFVLIRFGRALMPSSKGWRLVYGTDLADFREVVEEYILVQLDVLENQPMDLPTLAKLFYLVASGPHRPELCSVEGVPNETHQKMREFFEPYNDNGVVSQGIYVSRGIHAYLALDLNKADGQRQRRSELMQDVRLAKTFLNGEVWEDGGVY